MGLGDLMQGVGSLLGGIGQSQAGSAERAAYYRMAKQARKEARESQAQTDYRVRMIYESGQELLSEIEAETGKSGLAMTGTPLATLVDNARRVELSAALEKRAGALTYERTMAQAAAYEQAGRNAKAAGGWNAAATWLSGFGQMIAR